MATPTTRGPLEQRLLTLLNSTGPVTIEQVQALVTELLDCAREDVYQHQTYAGTVVPEKR